MFSGPIVRPIGASDMGDNPQGMSDSGRQNWWQVLAPKICTSCQNLNNCILCGDQLWGILKKSLWRALNLFDSYTDKNVLEITLILVKSCLFLNLMIPVSLQYGINIKFFYGILDMGSMTYLKIIYFIDHTYISYLICN